MFNISNETAIKFLITFFENKNIITLPDNWIILKRYKNIFGHICIDFKNEYFPFNKNKRCVLVINEEDKNVKVLEDKDETYFLEEAKKLPAFIYIIVNYQNKILFHFEPYAYFLRNKKLNSPQEYKYLDILKNKLNALFGSKNCTYLENINKFSISNINNNEIIKLLNLNKFAENLELFDYFDKTQYQLINKNISFVEEYNNLSFLTEQEKVDYLIKTLIEKTNFTKKEFNEIKFLINNILSINYQFVLSIASTLNSFQNENIKSLLITKN